MLRRTLVIAMILAAGTAAAKPSKPERMHRAAIPDGAGWWCYAVPSALLSGCMRSQDKCRQLYSAMSSMVEQMGRDSQATGVDVPAFDDPNACEPSHEVWVRTGMEGSEWRYLAAPSKPLCENAPSWGIGMYGHESGCERWHETEAPPDAAAVPAGKGWWCYAAGATSICARTKDWCAVAYRISHGDGSAPACKPSKRAFVFTSAGAFHAFGDDAACEAARDDDEAASTCAPE